MNSITQNMSQTQILDAVKQLPTNELEDFVSQVLVFQAKRRAKNLPEAETRLLKNIYRKFSSEKLARLRELKEKRLAKELNEVEYEELASLTDSLEEFHAQRMKSLVKLAKIRGISLEETMRQLGIKLPDYD